MGINLKAPSGRQSPILVVDSKRTTGGSTDSINPVLTKVGNPLTEVQVCQEWNSAYPLLAPRLTYAQLTGQAATGTGLNLTATTNGMFAYDTTNNGLAVLANGQWITFNSGMVSVTLNQAAVRGMYAAPFQIIAAPGAGLSIVVSRAVIVNNFNTAAFATGGVTVLQYGNAVHGAGLNALGDTFPAAFVNSAASEWYPVEGITGAGMQVTANLGLFLSNQTAAFTAGNAASTLVVNVWYSIIPANA